MTETTPTAAKSGDTQPLVITRTFDAPRELVWLAWTDPMRLAKWWGTKDFPCAVESFDLRPGGIYHYSMQPPQGSRMYGRFLFQEIAPPEKLVWISSFADAEANIARAPFSPDFPAEILSTLTLTDAGDNTTVLTLHGVPIRASDTERAAFAGMLSGMQGGWKGTLDALDAFLTGARESNEAAR